MTVVNWLGCDLVSGRIIEELPDLIPGGSLSSVVGAYSSASFRLPLALNGFGAPPKNWEAATEKGRTMIVAVLDGNPVWAGIVLVREGGTDGTVDIGTVSLEGYLDRRYAGNHTWTQQDEASVIAAGLIADANVEGITIDVDAPATGTLRDRAYKDQDDKTVYSALQELMGVQDGPEWTIMPGWTGPTQTRVSKTFLVRKRIGFVSKSSTPERPTGSANAVFSSEGQSEATYRLREDYSDGNGANHIVATSSGEGDTRPQSTPARAANLIAAGWPRWERRFSPSTSITNIATLNAHASAALKLIGLGTKFLKISARADAYPRLGTDWFLGDDIGYDLKGHRQASGLVGVARCVGWNFDTAAGIVEPILYSVQEVS